MGDESAAVTRIEEHQDYNLSLSVLEDISNDLYGKAIAGIVSRGGFTDEEFNHFYHGLNPYITNIVNKYGSSIDPSDRNEVVQDVFSTIYHKISEFRLESAFTTWVYMITANQTKNYIRSVNRRIIGPKKSISVDANFSEENDERILYYFLPPEEETQEDNLILDEISQSLCYVLCKGDLKRSLRLQEMFDSGERNYHLLLKLLGDDEKTTMLVMATAYGESYDYLSDFFDIPVGTVKSSVFRAKNSINPLVRNLIDEPLSDRELERLSHNQSRFDPMKEYCNVLCDHEPRKAAKLENILNRGGDYHSLSALFKGDLDRLMLVLFYSYELPAEKIADSYLISENEVKLGIEQARVQLARSGFFIDD